MNTDTADQDQNLFLISDTPNVKLQMEEFERAGGAQGYSNRRSRNDAIRYNRWPGRTSDYRKHKEAIRAEPIPHEDAWDGRLYTSDNICSFLVDVAVLAFSRGQFEMKPTGAEDVARAAHAKKLFTKYVERARTEGLNDEAEFLAQFGVGYGSGVWQAYWDRQVAMKLVPVTMEKIMQASEQALGALGQLGTGNAERGMEMPAAPPPEVMTALMQAAMLPDMVLDPAREAEAMALFQQAAQQMAAQMFKSETDNYGEGWLKNYQLSAKHARQLVRDLRKEGRGEFPAPYLSRNQPCAIAREPGVDYFCPPEMTEPETSPWHIVREFLHPWEIEAARVTDGWDEEWCKAAIQTAGKFTNWGSMDDFDEVEIEEEGSTYTLAVEDTKSGRVEVLHFYAKYTSPEGIPQVWCSVICPHALKDERGEYIWAKHYATGDSHYGFFDYRPRRAKREFRHTIGVPELVGSDQMGMKLCTDALLDRMEVELNPGWFVRERLGLRYKAGPGAQIPRKRPGDIEPVPPPTGNPEVAFKLIELTQARLDNQFGLMTANVLPSHWQSKLGAFTQRFLQCSAAMFKHWWRLIQRHADRAELARIAGEDPDFPTDPAEISGEYDITLGFDVKDMDMDFVFKKLEAIGKWAMQFDRAGVVDMAGLVRLAFLAIDPTYAQALIRDERGASKLVRQQVAQDVAMMALGNEADYVENDPTAGMKLRFLDEIVQGNPRYQAALGIPPQPGAPPVREQVDPLFMERFLKYRENLQHSVQETQISPTQGRLGMTPDALEGEAVGE